MKSPRPKGRNLVPTGMDTFDSMLGGGIPEGSIIALTGEGDSGHRLFARQVLYSKARYHNVKVGYLTVEEPPHEVVEEMEAYDWSLDHVEGRWEFIDGYTPRMNVRKGLLGRTVMLDLLLEKLPSLIKEGGWTVVDTFSYYMLLFDLKDVLHSVDVLKVAAREHGGVHFLILIHGLHENTAIATISHFADGFLEFTLKHEEAEAVGTIRVKKLARSYHAIRGIPYRVTRMGIMMETTMRVA